MSSDTFDVVVIGAGVAGMAAATRLAESGARVCVLEARPALGGRATSHRDPVTGEVVDNGQHILMGCYRESFALLRRLGTDRQVYLQRSLEVPMVDTAGRRTTLSCSVLPAPWHLLGGVIEWEALSWGDRLSVFGVGPAILTAQRRLQGRTSHLAASPDETIDAWLVRNGQSRRLREMLWEPLALAAMNQPSSEAGAAAFVRILADVFGPNPEDSSLAWPRVPLARLYAEPGRAFVEARGGSVRTNALARVSVAHDRVAAVHVRGGDTLRAAAVVSTVPWHAMRGLFDEVPPALAETLTAASLMKAYPIVTVNLWFDRPVLDTPFVGLPGRDMQWVFDKRAVFEGGATHLSLVSSGAGTLVAMPNGAVIERACAELRAALPHSASAVLRHATVVRERLSTFSVSPGEPARPACRTAVRGFFLAGDWTDTALPGTIESAALSGHRAAHDVTVGV